MEKLLNIFITVLLLGFSYCQNINEIQDEIKNKLGDMPGISELNSTNLETVEEDAKKLLRDKCVKNGAAPSVVDDIQAQKDNVQACVQQFVNVTALQEEIEKAKKTGSMDEVFGKYCQKYPDIYKCFLDVTDVAKRCMSEEEKKSLQISINITEELKEFVCYKDGDRIAMFVAEGGVTCFQKRQDALQACVNSTVGKSIPTDMSTAVLPEFTFNEKTCQNFDTIRQCVIKELEKCDNTTPANIVEAFFKFLKKHVPCDFNEENVKLKSTDNKNSSSRFVHSLSITSIALFILLTVF